jgi:hypothetical protein
MSLRILRRVSRASPRFGDSFRDELRCRLAGSRPTFSCSRLEIPQIFHLQDGLDNHVTSNNVTPLAAGPATEMPINLAITC